jgi:hypothetical protein
MPAEPVVEDLLAAIELAQVVVDTDRMWRRKRY